MTQDTLDDALLNEAAVVIVGAGFYGATLAERIAAKLGRRVLLIDRRNHIGGNAYSETDPATGVEIHRYGPHLFHTSNEEVWAYLGRFSGFSNYRHRGFTTYRDKVYPVPINLATICQFFGRKFSPDEARALIAEQSAELGDRQPANLEEKAISLIGRPLYEALHPGIQRQAMADRPARTAAADHRPAAGALHLRGRLFHRPIPGPAARWLYGDLRADACASTDRDETRHRLLRSQGRAFRRTVPVVYTGPIDRYFDFAEGDLGWRTIDIELEVMETPDYPGHGDHELCRRGGALHAHHRVPALQPRTPAHHTDRQ